MSILFTKNVSHTTLLEGIAFDCIPFISIEIYPKNNFDAELKSEISHFIITSKNGAKAIENTQIKGKFYVVGQKTAQILKNYNKNVVLICNSAVELAEAILQLPKSEFIYFSGSLRRNELFEKLSLSEHIVKEIEVYKTLLNPIKIEKDYKSIVFFSPSAVKSFFLVNVISNETTIFAIGDTTADEVRKYGDFMIKIPKEPTEEAIIQFIANSL